MALKINSNKIADLISTELKTYKKETRVEEVGKVIMAGDGIARIYGLASAKYNELLQFPNEIMGIVMNLEEDSVAAIILGDYAQIKEGDEVQCTRRIAEVPVGKALTGRVVDPLGRPLDGKGAVRADKTRALERVAPNVASRQSVNKPVQTGIKAIDSLIPLGRGQRELIIATGQQVKQRLRLMRLLIKLAAI